MQYVCHPEATADAGDHTVQAPECQLPRSMRLALALAPVLLQSAFPFGPVMNAKGLDRRLTWLCRIFFSKVVVLLSSDLQVLF